MKLRPIILSALIGAAASLCLAQPGRILSAIDNSRTSALPGRVHPSATAANDAGEVAAAFPLRYMSMVFHPSAAQKADLAQLLADQQNPASSRYRQWLTPEQYADRFGLSAADIAQVTAWLQSQGFTIHPASRSRTFVSFSGTAGQVSAAFGTRIHQYNVNGVTHFANSTDLTVPAALSPLVANVRGLNDFVPKPRIVKSRAKYTLGPGSYVLAPDDFATIYDIAPLYSAGTDGSGVKIAVVGQSEVRSSDISNFWTKFGLKSVTLSQILATPGDNPGIQSASGDIDESTLDVEWSGAVARGGVIEFVYSGIDVGVWNSAQYVVDNDVAPILSMSYGECEIGDFAILPTLRQLVQQANAEGITWLAAAGDQGATDCDAGVSVAENGLAVDEPGSIPEVTSMGGTALSASSAYWNNGDTPTGESARTYSSGEEVAWNESAELGQIWGTGGGASMYFPQPSWQTNAGVPNDGWRHVPDISFNASVASVPYYVYCSACEGNSGGFEPVGGTSCATPTMAGVVALLNQSLGTNGLGNINPSLYNLYKTTPGAFHNNVAGDNIQACAYGSPGCSNGQEGYTSKGSGYSSVVGFGSVDVTRLVDNWKSAQPTGPVVVASLDQNPVYQGNSESCGNSTTWNFQVTLTEEAGFATSVTAFSVNGTDYSSQIGSIFHTSTLGARQSISGCMTLPSVNAPTYEAFNVSGPDWTTAVNMSFQGPQTQLAVGGASNAASFAQSYAPGMILAVFGAGLGSYAEAAATIPLPSMMGGFEAIMCPVNCSTANTGWPVYLYYVGPNQVNVQIPYEASGAVDLNLGNPYANIDYFFTVSPIAPGIFTFLDGTNDLNPNRSASPGQTSFLYITGEGQVSPSLSDGASPAAGTPLSQLPKPREAVTVTVGGIDAPTTFVGIPSGLVGVTQVNFTIPSNAPSGRQAVVVTVGTVSTPAAFLTIQ